MKDNTNILIQLSIIQMAVERLNTKGVDTKVIDNAVTEIIKELYEQDKETEN